jgi:hypothetical protein
MTVAKRDVCDAALAERARISEHACLAVRHERRVLVVDETEARWLGILRELRRQQHMAGRRFQ